MKPRIPGGLRSSSAKLSVSTLTFFTSVFSFLGLAHRHVVRVARNECLRRSHVSGLILSSSRSELRSFLGSAAGLAWDDSKNAYRVCMRNYSVTRVDEGGQCRTLLAIKNEGVHAGGGGRGGGSCSLAPGPRRKITRQKDGMSKKKAKACAVGSERITRSECFGQWNAKPQRPSTRPTLDPCCAVHTLTAWFEGHIPESRQMRPIAP